jgi:hypothetical protein
VTRPRAAADFPMIRARMEELRRERARPRAPRSSGHAWRNCVASAPKYCVRARATIAKAETLGEGPSELLEDMPTARPHPKLSGCKFLRTTRKSASICDHRGAKALLRSLIHPSQGVTVLPCCKEKVTRA